MKINKGHIMQELARTKVLMKILSHIGNYEVTFKKIDGSKRVMLARQRVAMNLKGSDKEYDASTPYITTFDVDIFEYRTINLSTIIRLRLGNTIYKVVG